MTPYYQEDGITIYHGDCQEVLPLVDAQMMLTDPPYGIHLSNHRSGGRSYSILGDEAMELGQLALDMWTDRPTIAFASPMKPWSGRWRQHLVWWKGPAVGGGGDPGTCWKMDHELIQVRHLGELCGDRQPSVIERWIVPSDSVLHPAQKPLDLVAGLINKTTWSSVLDPFMGSGTTLVAAKNLGRKAIGIEIDERYCEIAAKRLAQGVLDFA